MQAEQVRDETVEEVEKEIKIVKEKKVNKNGK